MSQEFELEVSVPSDIREKILGQCAIETDNKREGSCDTCTIALSVSPKARKFLMKACTGLKLEQRGCDQIYVCQSPNKTDTRME